MSSIRTSVSMIALFFVLFSVSTAQAVPFISAYEQTICIDGSGDGTSWDWELRPAGGGTPFCLGTESVTGTQAQLADAFAAAIDLCDADTVVYSPPVGPSCPGGMSGFTIARSPDSQNWELAVEDNDDPPNLKVVTAADPVSFNANVEAVTDIPIPCNGNNPCCSGQFPPCPPPKDTDADGPLNSLNFRYI